MSYQLVVTNTGLTKLANANIEGTQLQLTQFGVGDGTITPDPSMTALAGEQYVGDINRIEVTDGVIVADLIIPADVGGWYIREAGIYDGDGDLFAIANVPVTYKVSPSEGAAKSVQLRLKLVISDTSLVSFTTDETVVYATQSWSLDKFGDFASFLTTVKTNVVGAVNELYTRLAGLIDDTVTVTDKTFSSQKIMEQIADSSNERAFVVPTPVTAANLQTTLNAAAGKVTSTFGRAYVTVVVPEGEWDIDTQIIVPARVNLECRGVLYNTMPDKWAPLVKLSAKSRCDSLMIYGNLGSGVEIGEASADNNIVIGDIRLWNIGEEYDGTYGPKIGVKIQGYNIVAHNIDVDGGNIGIDIEAGDVRITSALAFTSSTGMRLSGSEHVFVSKVQLDSNNYKAFQLDTSRDVHIGATVFLNDNEVDAGSAMSSGYAVSIGEYSSDNQNTNIDLDLTVTNTNGTAVKLGNITDSRLRVNINNAPLYTGNSYPVTAGIEYGSGVGANVHVGGIVDLASDVIVGTVAGAYDLVTNGVSNISHNHDASYLGKTDTAVSAAKLATARTISLSGDASGSTSFDGSGNVSISVAVADDSHNHIVSNIDGLQTALDGKLATTAKAADSSALNGATDTTAATANTIAKRDGSADITARLFRSTYGEQTTAPASTADIAFRNSTSDNYIRFMSLAAAQSYLGVNKNWVLKWSGEVNSGVSLSSYGYGRYLVYSMLMWFEIEYASNGTTWSCFYVDPDYRATYARVDNGVLHAHTACEAGTCTDSEQFIYEIWKWE